MNFKLNLFGIACVLLIVILIAIKAEEFNSEEITSRELNLRNQLLADVLFIKDGVEVLKKKYNTQIDTLNTVQSKLLLDDNDEEKDGFRDRITGMFNATLRKYSAFESRLITKLEDVLEEQTILLGEIKSKQDKLNKNCDRLQKLEVKITEQKSEFNTFVESQNKLLQQISDKLNENHDMLEKFEKELLKLDTYTPKPPRKLPMEIILGLTTANVYGDLKFNEGYSLRDDPIVSKITALLNNALDLDFNFYKIHKRLHLQSDLISIIRTEILNTKTAHDQCNTLNLFNEIEYRLNGIYRSLMRQMNNNNDKNLDLMDPILFKMNTFRDCSIDNNGQQLKEIKRQLKNNESKMTEFVERLEIFERNLEKLGDLENMKTLVSISEQIDTQLNIQADKLHKFNEHFSGLQSISIMDVN